MILHCCECIVSEAGSLNKPTDGMVCDYILTALVTDHDSWPGLRRRMVGSA